MRQSDGINDLRAKRNPRVKNRPWTAAELKNMEPGFLYTHEGVNRKDRRAAINKHRRGRLHSNGRNPANSGNRILKSPMPAKYKDYNYAA